MSEEDQNSNPEIVLETPPAPETPISGLEITGEVPLFSPVEESLALLNARFVVVDGFLRLLTRDMVFNDFVREILTACMKVVKCEAGSIFEVDHANQNLFFRAVVGQSSDTVTNFTIPLGQGIVGHVAESRQPLVVADAEENAMHLRSIARAVGFEARNLVAVPIVIRGKTYGVLELLNRVGESNFTASDLELLNYFCEMAAKALEVRFMISWGKTTETSTSEKAA